MIACYAWSNMMVLNAINIKENFYPDEEMDIFIRMTPGISRSLLGLIKSKDIFANIYYTNVPSLHVYGKLKKKLKIDWIGYYRKYHRQYNRLLFNLIGDKKYNMVLIAGFWNDSLYYVDYFYKNNPKLQIVLYDEGGASYDNPKRNLCRYYCNKNITPWRSRVKRFSVEKIMEIKYKHLVQSCIYLYSPERYEKVDRKMKVKRIPHIDLDNEKIYDFFVKDMSNIYEQDLLPYVKKDILFITMGNSKWIPDCEGQLIPMISALVDNVNTNNVIIKTHPNNTSNRLQFAKQFEDIVYVDRGNQLLEYIYPNIDIENKLLITYASSSAMYVKSMFNKEPYVILTYRLFHQYHERGDINAEKYYEDMKNLFDDKTKIYVPNTIDEYVENIREVVNKLIKYK